MAVEALIPKLTAVVLTAAIDSINPCAIGVLILLVTLLAGAKDKMRLLKVGLVYVFAVFAVYLLAGLGLIYFLSSIPLKITEYISLGVGTLIVILGLVEIKDFFWYGRGFSLMISPEMAKRIHQYTQNISYPGVIFLGAFVAAVELPCTGAPYLAIITLLSQQFDVVAALLLILYNIIFVLPLLIILLLVYGGTKVHIIKQWKQANRAYMRLATGVLLVGLGWLLILIANGTISLI